MVPSGFFLRFGCTTAAVVAGGMLVACSGGADSPGGPPTPSGSSTTGRPTPTPPPATRASKDPYPALCQKIDPKDAQALFATALRPMTTGGSSDCQFTPRRPDDTDTLKVYLRINDRDRTLYDHVGDISYGTFAPLSGVGYQAKWGSTPGSPPTVVDVRHGSFTCTVIPPPSVADLRLAHTGTALGPTVTRRAAETYARALARVCQDVFAAR